MSVFSRLAFIGLCTMGLAACSTMQQSSVPAGIAPTGTDASLLRVATGTHATFFSARASYITSARGLAVSIDGRAFFFSGNPDVELVQRSGKEPARFAEAHPVTCASCADGSGGGWSGQNPNSVQSVQVSATTLDVTFTASGSGDTVTITANGQTTSDYTSYSSGTLIDMTYDASFFGGSIPLHGQVTVTSHGVTVGTGSW